MIRKTNAARLLDAAGVDYELVAYDLRGAEFSAEAVAAAIGLPADRVFKTLAARGGADDVRLAVVPGGRELDLKALARAAGTRKMELLAVSELPAATGYRRGAVTALGTARRLPVHLDASALRHDTIAVSAGAAGLQVLLAPADYVRVTGATVSDLRSTGS